MNVQFTCPRCQATLSVPGEQVGRTARCPKCSEEFPIPAAAGKPHPTAPGLPSEKNCTTCGASIHPMAEICPHCGVRQAPPPAPVAGQQLNTNRIAAGICALLLGALGVHKFILGYTTEGLIMVLVSVLGSLLTCGVGAIVMSIIGIVEGIIYLTKSEEDFHQIYELEHRGWF